MADEPQVMPLTPNADLGNNSDARNPAGDLKGTAAPPSPTSSTDTTPPAAPSTDKPAADVKDGSLAGGKTDDKAPPAEPAKAPDTYADFKAPDGYEWDKAKLGDATALFKESGLTQEQAQKFMDLYAADMTKAAQEPYNQFVALRNEWRDGIIKDPTLGNGKDNLKPEVLATIGRAIDSLPNASEFREAMALTGAGDNPAFVKAFYNLAQRLGEGTAVKGGNPSPGGQSAPGSRPPSAAAAMYPNNPRSS